MVLGRGDRGTGHDYDVAIWDSFLFNDEVGLLDVRLRLLAGTVDHVVIVQGTTTFSGSPKPLHLEASGIDTSWFPGSVHRVVADLDAGDARSAWDRENAQRAALGAHLSAHADPDDLLLIGDVDELPRPAVLERLARRLVVPARLRLVDALYYANWHQPRPWTLGPIATRLDGFDHPSVRGTLGTPLGADDRFVEEFVPDAGWHLSFLGGAEAIATKLSAYSHQELNTEAARDPEFLARCLRLGVHFAGWTTLRHRSARDLDPDLLALAGAVPELFDLSARPAPVRARIWCGWAWLRRRLPSSVVRWGDAHPGAVTVAGGPLLLPLQLARELQQRRSPEPRWPPGKEFRPSAA